MVEFALVVPIVLVVVMGVVIAGLVVTNYVQLSNAVRDGARAAGICGGSNRDNSTTHLPDGTQCSSANLTAFVQGRLQAVPAPVSFTVNVLYQGAVLGHDINQCSQGATIEISANYPQPLYMPLVGDLLANTSGNARIIQADAEATCEQ
jgi:Flp pilus assembly protein TadG